MCVALAWALRRHWSGQTQSLPSWSLQSSGKTDIKQCDHVTDNSQHLLNAISVMIIFGCGLGRLKDWLKRHESTFSPPTEVRGLAVQGWYGSRSAQSSRTQTPFILWHCSVTPTHSPDGCSGSATSAPEGVVLEAFPTWGTSSGTGMACRALYGIRLTPLKTQEPLCC